MTGSRPLMGGTGRGYFRSWWGAEQLCIHQQRYV